MCDSLKIAHTNAYFRCDNMREPIQFLAERIADEVIIISKKKKITIEEALLIYKFAWETS